MNNINHMVKLLNGSEVTWEEFSKWSIKKQNYNLSHPKKGTRVSEKGREKMRESWKRLISERGEHAFSGSKQIFGRKVMTPKGQCETITEASFLYGVRGNTIKEWIKTGKEGFLFLTPPRKRKKASRQLGTIGDDNKSSKAVITPVGRFPSIVAAAKYYKVDRSAINRWIKKLRSNEFKYETEQAKPPKVILTPKGMFLSVREAAKEHRISPQSMRERIKSESWVDFQCKT